MLRVHVTLSSYGNIEEIKHRIMKILTQLRTRLQKRHQIRRSVNQQVQQHIKKIEATYQIVKLFLSAAQYVTSVEFDIATRWQRRGSIEKRNKTAQTRNPNTSSYIPPRCAAATHTMQKNGFHRPLSAWSDTKQKHASTQHHVHPSPPYFTLFLRPNAAASPHLLPAYCLLLLLF